MNLPEYNWIEIKNEYLTDPKSSYRKLSEKYGPSGQAIVEHAANENWQEEREKSLALIDRKLNDTLTNDIVQFQAEKLKLGKYVVGRSIKGMQKHAPRNFREAREGVETGYKIATEAMGLDNPKTQVNIQNNNFMSLTDFMTEMQKRKEMQQEDV